MTMKKLYGGNLIYIVTDLTAKGGHITMRFAKEAKEGNNE